MSPKESKVGSHFSAFECASKRSQSRLESSAIWYLIERTDRHPLHSTARAQYEHASHASRCSRGSVSLRRIYLRCQIGQTLHRFQSMLAMWLGTPS